MVFQPPASVDVVGSYPLQAAARPAVTVDVAVTIPSAWFIDKDQLNHRYHAKRAAYLAHIAKRLRKKPEFADQSWELLNGDARCVAGC